MENSNSLHWQTHEYEDRDRSPDWFWAVGIIAIAAALASVILGNVLLAIIILLGSFTLLIYAARKPNRYDVVIDNRGVRIDKYFYPYHTLESFWVEEHKSHPHVLIKSQKLLMPYIVVHINEIDPREVDEFLSHHLPKIFHSESIFHRIMDRLGF
jgi:hypothetical protein